MRWVKMTERKRAKHELSFKERLKAFGDRERKKADRLPAGPERDLAMTKARQADTASNIEEWANSPGLQPPK
jgi:hypothetical protein